MFDPLINVSWSSGLLWLSGIAVIAFLVSWALSDLKPSRRVVYIPVLASITGVLVAAYLIWSEAGTSFWTNHWGYGLVGALVAGSLLTMLLSRAKVPGSKPHPISAQTIGWDGLVYGAAEGILLSVLPVLVMWQTFSSNGWDRGWRGVVAGLVAFGASILVIVIHHLGYPDFRRSATKMGQAVLGCGVLSVAYLLTASVIAPVLAHALLHVVAVRNGMELPPHEEAPSSSAGGITVGESEAA